MTFEHFSSAEKTDDGQRTSESFLCVVHHDEGRGTSSDELYDETSLLASRRPNVWYKSSIETQIDGKEYLELSGKGILISDRQGIYELHGSAAARKVPEGTAEYEEVEAVFSKLKLELNDSPPCPSTGKPDHGV